jgi:glyoxylase I family protein
MPVGTKNSIIKGCGAHHIALQARDWEASMRLYQEVLGMQVAFQWESGAPPGRKVALLDMGDGSHMELFSPLESTPAPGSPATNDPIMHIALATTDARGAIEHVRQAGYEVTVEPKDVQLGALNVTIAFFRGPSGELVEFFQTH